MYIVLIISMILVWLLGLYWGILITERRWENNAFTPTRLECKGKLYKVVRVHNSQSWDYLELHK